MLKVASLVVVVMAVGCYGSGGGQSVDFGENNAATIVSFQTPLENVYGYNLHRPPILLLTSAATNDHNDHRL
jgi:hypothetical protein